MSENLVLKDNGDFYLKDAECIHTISSMRAVSKSKASKGLWMENVAPPLPGPKDVLVKVTKAAICGTDKHIFDWDDWASSNIQPPLILGHEFVGKVIMIGAEVKNVSLDDRVSAEGHVVCYSCSNCLAQKYHLCPNTRGIGINIPGAFAEYVCVPSSNIVKIPDDISDEIAALLDPFGNAVHTALSFDLLHQDVIVTGAGPIGIMAALICQHVGAKNVILTEVNPYRIDLARKAGVKNVINVSRDDLSVLMKDLSINEGFDVGLEMSGTQKAINTIIKFSKNGCSIAVLGISTDELVLPWNEIIFKMITIKGIYGREIFGTWEAALQLLQDGLNIGGVVTHRLKFEDFEHGFSLISSGRAGKVILEM